MRLRVSENAHKQLAPKTPEKPALPEFRKPETNEVRQQRKADLEDAARLEEELRRIIQEYQGIKQERRDAQVQDRRLHEIEQKANRVSAQWDERLEKARELAQKAYKELLAAQSAALVASKTLLSAEDALKEKRKQVALTSVKSAEAWVKVPKTKRNKKRDNLLRKRAKTICEEF